MDSLAVLILSTLTISLVHALAPDHWIPFVAMARAQNWSKTRLAWITFLCGLGHVGSSIVIGVVGLLFGIGLSNMSHIESQRAEVAGLLLIGFGLAYAIWAWKSARHHSHTQLDAKKSVTVWALIAIFVLGPCEPLIPLMFLAAAHTWTAVILISVIFSIITLIMMVGQALLGYMGVRLIRLGKLEHYGHTLVGLVIAITGGMVMALGI